MSTLLLTHYYQVVVAWDQLQRRELLYTADKTELLEIKYDELRPVTWVTPYQAKPGHPSPRDTTGQYLWRRKYFYTTQIFFI